MSPRTLADQLSDAADRPEPDLAKPAFLVARIEYPRLDPGPYLDRLDHMGEAASNRVHGEAGAQGSLAERVASLNRYLFDELGFFGNRERYEDPRNSCLNEVLDRRTGIPITLSLVYIEVARRAGLRAEGVNFPGHFLVRVLEDLPPQPASLSAGATHVSDGLIVDPFHGGTILDEQDCRLLLHRQMGADAAFDPHLLAPATRRQILVRMLLNLKRLYVHMRSFPQARLVTDLLLALSPSSLAELRDRGLLAYHMNDFNAALTDLEKYLRLFRPDSDNEDEKRETQQLWEHVKALKRRIASFN
jgi:regulator of sirC expression with transglutaminase-like and TPR domain